MAVLSNRIDDYYENVKVNFNFNSPQKMIFEIYIELSEDEKLELKEWIEKYSPKVYATPANITFPGHFNGGYPYYDEHTYITDNFGNPIISMNPLNHTSHHTRFTIPL